MNTTEPDGRTGRARPGAAEEERRCVSADETRAFGRSLAARLGPGSVVLLFGELGSGKTCLVQGIAAGLGMDPRRVHSPSFIMVNRYEGHCPLNHVDLYRLREGESLVDLDLGELFAGDGITVVEWAERLPEAARPRPRLDISLSHLEGGGRLLRLRPVAAEETAAPERAGRLSVTRRRPL